MGVIAVSLSVLMSAFLGEIVGALIVARSTFDTDLPSLGASRLFPSLLVESTQCP